MKDSPEPEHSERAIEGVLERSMQLHAAVAETLGLDREGTTLIELHSTGVAVTSASLSMEHADSLLVLMAHGNPNSATALLRMQFECTLRGAWAIYAATEDEIELLERELTVETEVQARKVAVYGNMLRDLQREGCPVPRLLLDELGRFDKILRHSLNSFVHGGFQPLKHHGNGFSLDLALQIIETSNAILTMAAALFAVLIDDKHQTLARLNALLPEFRDVLPELTIVQRPRAG